MRPFVCAVVFIAATSAAASADAPLDPATIPEQCRAIAKQASAPARHTALSARISLANCLADVKLVSLKLLDCEASILEVDDAMKQSFALLDEVTAQADDVTKIVAESARAELYANMQARMRTTLPPPGTTEASIALHKTRSEILESLMSRWRTAAAGAYERIVAIVKATPKLEKNPVVASAVRTARERLKTWVAKAEPAPQPAAPADERDKVITDEEELR